VRGLLILLLALARPAHAHVTDTGYAYVRVEGADAKLLLELTPTAVEDLAGLKEYSLARPEDVSTRSAALWEKIPGPGGFSVSSGECPWEKQDARLTDGHVYFEAIARCPATIAELRWEFPSVARMPGLEIIGTATFDQTARTFALGGGAHAEVVLTPVGRSWLAFVPMGMRHIGAWTTEWLGRDGSLHLPDGIDHLLFLLALVLGTGAGWAGAISLLATVTGFTLGHSVTLGLATLGIARLPSRLVESAIALTIAAVAADDLRARFGGARTNAPASTHARWRWALASAFGLIHGFGFATALAELQLKPGELAAPLFGFNLGVELGQAVIVALLYPLLVLARRSRSLERVLVPAGAAGVCAAGLYWFVRRSLAI
jgi:hypothetical protein